MPSTPEALPAHSWKDFGIGLQATDGPLREPASLRLGHFQEAKADRLGSITQCPLRGLVRDLGLSAQEGTGALIRGVDTQQFEHIRIIVHGSILDFWGIEACASTELYRDYLEIFKYIGSFSVLF
jgi:hypothetical protein